MNRSVATLAVGAGLAAGLGGALFWFGARQGDAGRDARASVALETDASELALERTPSLATDTTSDEARSIARAAERAPVASESGARFVLGTVVDPEGRPIGGARVTLYDGALYGVAEPTPRVRSEIASDALGRYRFAAPAGDGPFGVRVRAPGHASKSRNQSPDVDVPIELVPAGSWVGRVVGEGAERVHVLRAAEAGAAEPWVRADDGAGAFALLDQPVGRELVLHVVPEQGLAFVESFALPAPGEHEHDIVLGPSHRYETLVRDAFSGRPIAGARLGAASPHGELRLATSDASGRLACELQGPAREAGAPIDAFRHVGMSVRAEGYLVSETWLGLLALGTPIELVPAGRIDGRVLEFDGSPAAGATVAWVDPVRTYDSRCGALGVPAAGREVLADAEGRFTLEGVLWGLPRCEIVARLGGRARWILDAMPRDASTPLALEIRLPAGPALDGRVVWDEWVVLGQSDLSAAAAGTAVWPPAPRATVLLRDDAGRELARTTTDAGGRFAFDELPPASADVAIEGHELRVIDTDESGRDVFRHGGRLTLAILPPMRVVRGTLRAHDGEPLGRSELSAQVSIGGNLPETRAYFSTRTDGDGRFELSVPSFEGFGGVLTYPSGRARLEREADAGLLDWRLPELVSAVLELERLAPGAASDRPLRIAWRGPRPGEGGRSLRNERPVEGRLALELPLGELELVLDSIPPDPRATRRVTVRVERGQPGAPGRVEATR